MRYLLDIAYLLTAIAISPMVIYRMIAQNRYRRGWAQRFGRISRRNPDKKCIWIHAVSVGEVNATKTIVAALGRQLPQYEIIISTTTDTGFARATALYAKDHEVFFYPLDFSCVVRRAFRRVKPSLCLLMELEVWPNFLAAAGSFRVPVVVANGRISDNSYKQYRRIKPIARAIFSKLTLTLAQTDEYAERFARIGCRPDRVVVTGSLKYDTAQIADKVEGADKLASGLAITGDQRLFIAGGTGPDEERIILDVYKELVEDARFRDVRLALVPRKPERFDEVAQLIEQSQLPLIRYSVVKEGATRPHGESKNHVILGDTMGDLRKFYSIAEIIFVGRSLVPMGGSDMMEAAALGKTTIFGPHATNFRQTVDALLADYGAILVKDQEELLEALRKCLTDPEYAAEIARNGREVIKKNQGATQKTVKQIQTLLTSQ